MRSKIIKEPLNETKTGKNRGGTTKLEKIQKYLAGLNLTKTLRAKINQIFSEEKNPTDRIISVSRIIERAEKLSKTYENDDIAGFIILTRMLTKGLGKDGELKLSAGLLGITRRYGRTESAELLINFIDTICGWKGWRNIKKERKAGITSFYIKICSEKGLENGKRILEMIRIIRQAGIKLDICNLETADSFYRNIGKGIMDEIISASVSRQTVRVSPLFEVLINMADIDPERMKKYFDFVFEDAREEQIKELIKKAEEKGSSPEFKELLYTFRRYKFENKETKERKEKIRLLFTDILIKSMGSAEEGFEEKRNEKEEEWKKIEKRVREKMKEEYPPYLANFALKMARAELYEMEFSETINMDEWIVLKLWERGFAVNEGDNARLIWSKEDENQALGMYLFYGYSTEQISFSLNKNPKFVVENIYSHMKEDEEISNIVKGKTI
ncbi:hypothetical protein JXB01_03710 [Candidatus Micrarchaeota archaeon]|nr:hypothetical protein [Candidatus Micrarchaeota archaeon]